MSFEPLGLSQEVLKAIAETGYTTPTAIQQKAIPIVLMGRDLVGIAQTGTGKTASFTLPMIDILSQGRARARMPRSLILEPTRELAAQVAENFTRYSRYSSLSMALIIGGESMKDQKALLERGVDVLIATPGRLLDLFERGQVMLVDTGMVVIDEADRMLDMGFMPDVERIVSLLPQGRQTLLFSATMPKEIESLANRFLQDPKRIEVSPPSTTGTNIAQRFISTPAAAVSKREILRKLIQQEDVKAALVFCNRKRDVDTLYRSFKKHGMTAVALHGDMAQGLRNEALDSFKKGEVRYLICSDVAARGLDIPAVSHVFNFDVPHNSEDYVHRIGRTGRAGRDGVAITLASDEDEKVLQAIAKLTKVTLEKLSSSPALNSRAKAPASTAKKLPPKPVKRAKVREKPPTRAKTVTEPVRFRSEGEKKAVTAQDGRPEENTKPEQGTKKTKSGNSPFGDHVPAFFARS